MISIVKILLAWNVGALRLPRGLACVNVKDIHVWNISKCLIYINKVYIKVSLLIYRLINLTDTTDILPGKCDEAGT